MFCSKKEKENEKKKKLCEMFFRHQFRDVNIYQYLNMHLVQFSNIKGVPKRIYLSF